MDSFGSYTPIGGRPRPLSKREIEKMKKLMRRVPIIKKKNDDYHQKEAQDADNQFEQQLNQLTINN